MNSHVSGCLGLICHMRHLSLSIVLFFVCMTVFAQAQQSDELLLAKTRSLYDAPFTRNLVSFDCAVQFDWKKHFLDTLGSIPPNATSAAEHLQSLQHRVFVDRSGAVISEIPRATDLSNTPHGADLEQVLQAMVSSGLNAWLPFGANVILPVKPTKFIFKKSDAGYRLEMNGPGVEATLNLVPDLRITDVVSQLPQPLRFATVFITGPDGYLLQSVETSSNTRPDGDWESRFAYTYQAVQGVQIPLDVTVTMPTSEAWSYELNDCKVVTGIIVEVEASKH